MYNHEKETIYLLVKKGAKTFPLVKVVADTKGIKVFGLSLSHKGQYVHAEKYAESEDGALDKSCGHLHFRDTRAIRNWQDEAMQASGRKPGIRGGCQSIPPLDDLGGYLPLVTLGFAVSQITGQVVKQKYYKDCYFLVDFDDFTGSRVCVEVLLKGQGRKQLFPNLDRSNVWKSVVFDKKEPHIVFLLKSVFEKAKKANDISIERIEDEEDIREGLKTLAEEEGTIT